MKKKQFLIDFKVFEAAMASEIPFTLPSEMFMGNRLMKGIHSIHMWLTQGEFDELFFWCGEHEDTMKIIGDRVVNELMARV